MSEVREREIFRNVALGLLVVATSFGFIELMCQSALDRDPGSASKRDPFERRVRTVALAPSELVRVAENEALRTGVDPIIASPAYGNVSKVEQQFSEIRAPEPVDVAWISENYHDFKNMGQFSTDTNAMDRAVFAALKPGGTYVVTDYIAAAGSGMRDTQSLHRIDPEVIKREVTAAGFMLEAESNALMNPSDDLAVRSKQGSSQVMFRFRKPR